MGAAVTVTDPDDGDTLSGTDAASFAIGSSTGQLTTKSGVTYDYETKQRYSVVDSPARSWGNTWKRWGTIRGWSSSQRRTGWRTT